jgi:hypothetical protein
MVAISNIRELKHNKENKLHIQKANNITPASPNGSRYITFFFDIGISHVREITAVLIIALE